MKIKALSRSAASGQAPGSTVARQPRNLDPAQHPFERAREYTRALNAVKLERMFAAPFIAQLGHGHVEGVYSLAKDPESLERFASASGDGVLKVWDLPSREEIWQARAHANMVKSNLIAWKDRKLISCSSDKYVKLWDPYNQTLAPLPIATYLGQSAFTSVSAHRSLPSFAASCGSQVSVYDLSRPSSAPVSNLNWHSSVDTINTVSFNPVETSILGSVGGRSIVLYDLRTSTPLTKTTLALSSNDFSWNPMEAFNFSVANEDHNAYIFDSRNMKRALNIMKGHTAAMMSCSFSPTGEELVTASYDRSIRLWNRSSGHSRDVYHTKRMQRVFSATFTPDSNYILSGSDDGNVRLWRSLASKREGVKSARQRQKLEYDAALIERYQHMPEIKRIRRHRHIPKQIKKAGEIKGEELAAIRRRRDNERKHSKKGLIPKKAEREMMIVGTEE